MTLQQAIETVLEDGKKAFIPYIMAGDGGLEQLPTTILRLQKLGATAIEVGIPFTDPVADGPTIEKAGERALAQGTTLRKVLAILETHATNFSIPLVVMSYLNPILAYGAANFSRDAYAAGVRGVIVPDMPLEERAIIHPELKEAGIALVQLISLTSPESRIEKLATASEGFIYAVTVNGITGARADFTDNLPAHFEKLKAASSIPVLAGFGISTHEQVRSMSGLADGVIVGSKIVDAIANDDWTAIEDLMIDVISVVEEIL